MVGIKPLLGLVVLSLGVTSACGTSYDREDFISELTDGTGLDNATAACIADGAEAEMGVDRLSSRGSLTAEEESTLTRIVTDCALGSSGS